MSNEYILICVLLFIGWSILMCYAGWNGRRAEIEWLNSQLDAFIHKTTAQHLEIERLKAEMGSLCAEIEYINEQCNKYDAEIVRLTERIEVLKGVMGYE